MYLYLFRMRCRYVLTELAERHNSCSFTSTTSFYTTSLQSQWLQICIWMCIWVQPKKPTKTIKRIKRKQRNPTISWWSSGNRSTMKKQSLGEDYMKVNGPNAMPAFHAVCEMKQCLGLKMKQNSREKNSSNLQRPQAQFHCHFHFLYIL